MYQEHLAVYSTKVLQRSRNVAHVTWKGCSNVSSTSGKLLEEIVTTYQERLAFFYEENVTPYQERLASYLPTRLQRNRNLLQVTWRTSYTKKMLQCIRNVLQVTWIRCYKVSQVISRICYYVSDTSCKLLAIQGQPALNRCTTRMPRRWEVKMRDSWREHLYEATCISLRRIWQYMTFIYQHVQRGA